MNLKRNTLLLITEQLPFAHEFGILLWSVEQLYEYILSFHLWEQTSYFRDHVNIVALNLGRSGLWLWTLHSRPGIHLLLCIVSGRTVMSCFLTAGVSSLSPAVPKAGTFPSVALQLSNPVLPSSDLAFCVLLPLAVISHLFSDLFLCLLASMINCSDFVVSFSYIIIYYKRYVLLVDFNFSGLPEEVSSSLYMQHI